MESPLLILPESIDPEMSQSILNHTLKYGFDNPLVLNGVSSFIWKSFAFRRPVLTDELIDYFHSVRRFPDYWLRARTDLVWEWSDCKEAVIVKEILRSLDKYIIKLTRVQTLVLLPNCDLPAHTDKVAGTVYESDNRIFGLGYEEENKFHANNQFYALKIPLFGPHGFGKPFVEINNQIVTYDPKGHVFVIDEVNVKHGAFPVNFPRGVLVIDAVLNLNEIKKNIKTHELKNV